MNIFVVASTLRTYQLLASVIPVANAWDPGVKIFTVNAFADCDRSAKSTKILTREKFQLYGIWRPAQYVEHIPAIAVNTAHLVTISYLSELYCT